MAMPRHCSLHNFMFVFISCIPYTEKSDEKGEKLAFVLVNSPAAHNSKSWVRSSTQGSHL